jgi:hypothetical protein
VFDTLIESKRKADKKKAFGLGFVSLVGHGGVVVFAVIATLTAGQAGEQAPLDTMMVFVNQEEQKQEEQPPVLDIPQLKGFQTVVAPTDIPTNIPARASRAGSARGSSRRRIRCSWSRWSRSGPRYCRGRRRSIRISCGRRGFRGG